MGFDSSTATFRQLKSLSVSRVYAHSPPPLFTMLAWAHPELSIMNQRSSSIERCFAYALMDDSVALINKATSNTTGCVYNKSWYVIYSTDDISIISVEWFHDFINTNYGLSVSKVINIALSPPPIFVLLTSFALKVNITFT